MIYITNSFQDVAQLVFISARTEEQPESKRFNMTVIRIDKETICRLIQRHDDVKYHFDLIRHPRPVVYAIGERLGMDKTAMDYILRWENSPITNYISLDDRVLIIDTCDMTVDNVSTGTSSTGYLISYYELVREKWIGH